VGVRLFVVAANTAVTTPTATPNDLSAATPNERDEAKSGSRHTQSHLTASHRQAQAQHRPRWIHPHAVITSGKSGSGVGGKGTRGVIGRRGGGGNTPTKGGQEWHRAKGRRRQIVGSGRPKMPCGWLHKLIRNQCGAQKLAPTHTARRLHTPPDDVTGNDARLAGCYRPSRCTKPA
jgi:hypothetical protein